MVKSSDFRLESTYETGVNLAYKMIILFNNYINLSLISKSNLAQISPLNLGDFGSKFIAKIKGENLIKLSKGFKK